MFTLINDQAGENLPAILQNNKKPIPKPIPAYETAEDIIAFEKAKESYVSAKPQDKITAFEKWLDLAKNFPMLIEIIYYFVPDGSPEEEIVAPWTVGIW